MVASGVVFVALVFGWLGVYKPLVEKRDLMERKIAAQKDELMEVSALAEKYLDARKRFDRLDAKLKSQPPGFSPLAAIESLAFKAGVRDNVVSMIPQSPVVIEGYQESPVDLKLDKVTLPRLLAFLKSVRNSKNYMRIKRISIKTEYENPEMLSVSMTITGYEVSS